MSALVRAELVKLRSTRGWLVLLGCAGTLTLVNVGVGAMFAGWHAPGLPPPPGLDSAEGVRTLFTSVTGGTVIATLLGVVGVTAEYRHGTATVTFLGTPRRFRVVTAKLLAYLLAGAALGLIVDVVCLAGTELTLAVTGAPPVSPFAHGGAGIFAGAVLSYALHAVVGVGVGAVLRHQVAAILVVLVWTQAVEGTVVALLPGVGRWLLSGAGSALTRYGETTGLHLLPVWGGALLLLGYAAAFALLGYLATARRAVS